MLDTPQDPVGFLVQEARTNYAAFVTLLHRPRYRHSHFSAKVCRAIDKFVEDMLVGKRPVLMLTAPPQHGKLVSDHTPVLTSNRGWITHGKLVPGDSVFRPDGSSTRVVAVSPAVPCDVRLTFSDGSVIATHSNHEWQVSKAWINGRPSAVMETRAIIEKGLWKGEPGNRGSRANFQLPHVAALKGATRSLPLAPYALGVWLGDGVRTRPVVTAHPNDFAMIEGAVQSGAQLTNHWLHKTTGVGHYYFSGLSKNLRELELLNEKFRTQGGWRPKHIPDEYYLADESQRLELLAGLIDSDGYVYPGNGRVTFSTCEPELALSVSRLAATFGWRVTTTWFDPVKSSSGIQGKQKVAQVCFQPDRIIPCRLARKREAQKPDRMRRKRAIVAAETGEFGLGRCIQVEHEDGMYLIGDTLIPTHNSALISRCLAPYLFGRLVEHFPVTYIAGASYAQSLARRFSREIKAMMTDPIYKAVFPKTSLLGLAGVSTADAFDVPSSEPRVFSEYRGVGVGGPLTGMPLHVLLIDDSVKNSQEALSPVVQEAREAWFDSVGQTRMQERSGVVLIGTPWSANDLLARVRRKFAGERQFTLLSFPALNAPGEVGYNPELPEGPLVPHLHSADKLLEMKRHISEFWWAAMFQQVPMSEYGAIFKREHVQYYRRGELPAQFQRMVIAVDATFKDGAASDFVFAGVWGKTADERVWMIDWRREKLAFMATAQAIADLKRKHPRVMRIYIEDAANGAALIDMLKKHFPGLEGVPPLGSKEARAHAVSWVWENKCVMLPHPDENPGIVPVVQEITTFPDTTTGHDDCVDGMSIALQQLCLRSPISSLITQEILNRAR